MIFDIHVYDFLIIIFLQFIHLKSITTLYIYNSSRNGIRMFFKNDADYDFLHVNFFF